MKKVAVVYHFFPHYRLAVMRALDSSTRYEYSFVGSFAPFDGIKPVDPTSFKHFVDTPFRLFRGLFWQGGAVKAAMSRDYDALVFLANPNFVSTWVAAAIGRARGKRVLYWTHGWLKPETGAKALLRSTFYRLADNVMVYGERAKSLGVAAGYPGERIQVIYNSLDFDRASAIVADLEASGGPAENVRARFADPARPLIICTARITKACRFDLLIEAAAELARRGRPINVLLVGDGPERPALEALAREKGVDACFYGACYDEATVAGLIYSADLTVSPGKIGLTAMHTLSYGTPAITHSDMDFQMPEVEAIVEGKTGAFFRRDDAQDLADKIDTWLVAGRDRAAVRAACRNVIAEKWNADAQMRLIETAIARVAERA